MAPVRENNFPAASAFLGNTPPCVPSSDLLTPTTRIRPGCPPGPAMTIRANGLMPLLPGRIVVPPSTTGPIPSTSPMLTPPRGSTVMPGGGFYPMR